MASGTMPRQVLRGFTLIEMAVVLIIVALMSVYAIRTMTAQEKAACAAHTATALQDLRRALDRYAQMNARLPRPAGRSYGPNSPLFGQEAMSGTDGSIDRVAGPPAVLIGMVPVTALGLPPAMAADCWKNKYTYAVTEALTLPSAYNGPITGAIEVRTGTLAAFSRLTLEASYVVLSHGASAPSASAQNYSGAKKNCNIMAADATKLRIDKENCDTANAIFFSSDFNDGDDAAHFFDDYVAYTSRRLMAPPPPAPGAPPPADCSAGLVEWGGNCAAPALITLLGLSVTLTNINSGYTGVALSVCNPDGTRTTLGTCLPIGACSSTSPRGGPLVLLTGISMNYGTGVCKKYSCCNGFINITNIPVCLTPLDLPGLASCP